MDDNNPAKEDWRGRTSDPWEIGENLTICKNLVSLSNRMFERKEKKRGYRLSSLEKGKKKKNRRPISIKFNRFFKYIYFFPYLTYW